jgi:hypothetical protein
MKGKGVMLFLAAVVVITSARGVATRHRSNVKSKTSAALSTKQNIGKRLETPVVMFVLFAGVEFLLFMIEWVQVLVKTVWLKLFLLVLSFQESITIFYADILGKYC